MTALSPAEAPNVAPRGGTPAADWRAVVARYQGPHVGRAIFQLVSTLVLLGAGFYLMYLSLALPYWVTLLLAFPVAGMLVRTFIIMHDCAHASFLPHRRLNDAIGYVTGVLTLTPFGQWRRDHAMHHASSGDLDRRGHGDINTLTVREYLARTPKARFRYRLYRHPLTLLGLGPLHLMVGQRFRPRSIATGDKQIASVWWTNLGILVGLVGFSLLVGVKATVLVFFPAMYIAAAAGVWLFYVQHQFEDTYWEEHSEWNYATAAMAGSSYFKLPGILNWFTGSIGLHHVHHLGPRIPNYKLRRAHEENPIFHQVTIITLRQGISALALTLWDEDKKRLVRFSDVPELRRN
jgi:acyl-lipid omega-6 desaturase (Delta-12 desaturase)